MWTIKNKFSVANSSKTYVSAIKFKKDLYIGDENGYMSKYRSSILQFKSQYFTLKFDYLESCDVLEKITSFDIYDTGGVSQKIIVSNERNLKLIDVRNSLSTKDSLEENIDKNFEYTISDQKYVHTLQKEFSNIHSYMCNSVSLNNDSQYFITSDYLFINLWKPDILEGGYTIVNIKPLNQSSLAYVINTSKFSPHHNTIFGYSTTNGDISLNDIRLSSASDSILKIQNKDLNITDVALKSISDFCFVNENLLASRSLNNLILCDIRYPTKAVYNVTICDKIALDSSTLDTDAIYEKFRVCNNSKYVFTGSFSKKMYGINLETGFKEEIVLDKEEEDPELNKTKFVEGTENGFYVVYGDSVYEYHNL